MVHRSSHSETATLRFGFGRNWRSFLSVLDERRIRQAELAIAESLNRTSLEGQRVLDIGSGSGLSSLAMRRMSAQVVSFDFDPESVVCTKELRRRYDSDSGSWEVLQGSILDADFVAGLGQFDLVYSWGVLHHTGEMWRAIDLAEQRVAPGGTLLIALYNDQGWRSNAWRWIKRLYCSGWLGSATVGAVFYPLFFAYSLLSDLVAWKLPGTYVREYIGRRGMSIFHDWRDWLGGYPFEAAAPAVVKARICEAGFTLKREGLTSGWGCNEFVFVASRSTDG